ncbi:PadR family transcriptional regulator [Microbacterium aurum]|uniref:PadR family transcriptional regulator n=1 Tax=Microbacterium aurum TaxID=36805 RepID=UPI001EF6AEBF|nr:PadR family transcriptional regulator [Microbacterium aurum]MCG7413082.1 PadR family transcriptional regulator [Microbacterium aurum]
MTDATRLTPLGVMVLALLREDPMHPYEMIRLMRARHDDRIIALTNGTVYHTVARLERLGLVSEVGVDREGNRPERTTYALTDAGDAAITDWVRRELPRLGRPTEYRVALAEAHNLGREETLALLRRRLAALEEALHVYRTGLAKARGGTVFEQYLVEADREFALLTADRAWLAAFLDRLAHPDFVWGPHETDDRYLAQREAARQ